MNIKPVFPHVFALHHWPSLPQFGFWISAEFPVHLSLSPFAEHVHRSSGINHKLSLSSAAPGLP